MSVKILQGDCLTVLKTMPDASVHCCVTSPPYWGLRDYGTAKWDGGDPNCDHSPEKRGGRFATPVSGKQASNSGSGTISSRDCPCGAKRIDNQLGLEKTPEEYVAKMVAVFREVRRVLRSDGTCWLNLGDSYATPKDGNTQGTSTSGLHYVNPREDLKILREQSKFKKLLPPGMKPKDLVGIPWMVAFALRADGWYLRSDIIWHKPNPMPESVTDRPTKSHEYIFLLTKSAKYYYDAEAIKEASVEPVRAREKHNGESAVDTKERGYDCNCGCSGNRNKRSVWTVATSPYSDAHFATFPPKLITPCILAGCPEHGTILDPFGGSGTVGEVAEAHNRNSILIELNEKYIEMAKKRTAQQGLGI